MFTKILCTNYGIYEIITTGTNYRDLGNMGKKRTIFLSFLNVLRVREISGMEVYLTLIPSYHSCLHMYLEFNEAKIYCKIWGFEREKV